MKKLGLKMMSVLLLAAWTARAEDSAELPRPCRADVAKLCAGISPGEGRIRMCLRENASQLSPDCRGKIENARERVKQVSKACAKDAKTYCRDVEKGGGRVFRCLKGHETLLTKECRASLVSQDP